MNQERLWPSPPAAGVVDVPGRWQLPLPGRETWFVEVFGHPYPKGPSHGPESPRYHRRLKRERWKDGIRSVCAAAAQEARENNLPVPFFPEGAVETFMLFKFPPVAQHGRPTPRVPRYGPVKPHYRTPDADNLSKPALDAMNGIVFTDDSQAWLTIQKAWANDDNPAGLYLYAKPVDDTAGGEDEAALADEALELSGAASLLRPWMRRTLPKVN